MSRKVMAAVGMDLEQVATLRDGLSAFAGRRPAME